VLHDPEGELELLREDGGLWLGRTELEKWEAWPLPDTCERWELCERCDECDRWPARSHCVSA
jgi:hypothetical protein